MGALKLSYYDNKNEQSESCFAHLMVVHKKTEQIATHGDYYVPAIKLLGSSIPKKQFFN